MSVSDDTLATLLLNVRLPLKEGKGTTKDEVKSLSIRDWNKVLQWLKQKDMTPASLIGAKSSSLVGLPIDQDRLSELIKREYALAMHMDKWQKANIWVMTINESDYPEAFINKLEGRAPPVIFGCGEKSILMNHDRAVAIVGSRRASEADIEYSQELGRSVVKNGYSVVSGAARGIDESAMLGALNESSTEGKVAGVVAENLLRKSISLKYRQHLMDHRLVLISPFNPEARFNVGNAMARNKYIYSLAKYSIVVHSDDKGGTWHGAKENLHHRWSILYVRRSCKARGNRKLINIGDTGDTMDAEIKGLYDAQNLEEVELPT